MVKNSITVFARIKPEINRKGVVNYKIHRRPKKHTNEDFLVLTAPQKFAEYIDNRPESWNFSFNRIFEHDVGQDDVFENVARPVVNSVFDGYNATIFAYGQTGSGKTFTITGEPGIHSQRGILPRTLQYVFDTVKKNPENLYSVEVAYLEIYNENGYDLLLERKQREAATRIEDLPRVTIQEDENGTMHLKNLSFRIVENEKQALQFLVDGDMYRAISETPMNPRSSRSHCIFTIVVSVKKFGADRYSRAKMHLVDLAGSERVYKCSIQGTILTEAKHINLSLHFLEQVIVCLGQDNVSHVPYRNSLLTSILRDSLGGNCLTTMLATLSVSTFNLEETISTCRFAQRVALVKNDVNLTFELDTKSENLLLRMENERLKKQIQEMKKSTTELALCDSGGSLEYYKNLVVQRDQEISHLIELLKKERARRKSEMNETSQRAFSDVPQEQKAIQVPSSRLSPRNIDQTSPTKLKKRRHGNSLQGKAKPALRRNESVSPKTMRKIVPQNQSPVPEVPALMLVEDDLLDTQNSPKLLDSQINANLVHRVDSRTERKETIVTENHNQREPQTPNMQSLTGTDDNAAEIQITSQIHHIEANLPKQSERTLVKEAITTENQTQTPNMQSLRITDHSESKSIAGSQITSNASHIDVNSSKKSEGKTSKEVAISQNRTQRETQTSNTDYSGIHDKETKKQSGRQSSLETLQFDGDLSKKSKMKALEKDTQTPREEIPMNIGKISKLQSISNPRKDNKQHDKSTIHETLIDSNATYEIESNSSSRKVKQQENNSPRDKSPGLGFPQNVMKMIRSSRNRRSDDTESTNPKSPRYLKGSNIIRNMLCKEKKSARESPDRVEEKKSRESRKKEDDAKMIGNSQKPLPLTGDPEIDEEIIAFYKAKRSGGTY